MKQCILCNCMFSDESMGMMLCKIHPKEYNVFDDGQRFEMYRFDCCGASKMSSSRFYEWSLPKGCHSIDHVASFDELTAILKNPFVCVPALEFKKYHISKGSMSEEEDIDLISVLDKKMLIKTVSLRVCMGRTREISFKDEHAKIIAELVNEDMGSIDHLNSHQLRTLLYIDEKDQPSSLLHDTEMDIFHPFYIIRRVSSTPDRHKMEEINYKKKINGDKKKRFLFFCLVK